MSNYITLSNEKLRMINPKLYKVLATIPEDPYYWTDNDCYVFGRAEQEVSFFLQNNDDYVLVETYEKHEIPQDIGESEIAEGERKLVVFRRSDWERINHG